MVALKPGEVDLTRRQLQQSGSDDDADDNGSSDEDTELGGARI